MIATASCMATLTIPMTCLLRFLGRQAPTQINRGMLVLGVKKLILVLCHKRSIAGDPFRGTFCRVLSRKNMTNYRQFIVHRTETYENAREVMGSISVGDSDFFFVPRSCYLDQLIFHKASLSFLKNINCQLMLCFRIGIS